MIDYWRDDSKKVGMAPGNCEDVLSLLKNKIDPQTAFVIDLGCNRGWFSGFFPNYLGLDYNESAISDAKHFWAEKLSLTAAQIEKRFLFWDATAKISLEQKADLVICKDLLEHIPDGHSFLEWVKSILKTDGLFLLVTPDSQKWAWDDPTHIRPYSRIAHRALAKAQGFGIITESYESVMPGTQKIAGIFGGKSPLLIRMAVHIPFWRRNVVSLLKTNNNI